MHTSRQLTLLGVVTSLTLTCAAMSATAASVADAGTATADMRRAHQATYTATAVPADPATRVADTDSRTPRTPMGPDNATAALHRAERALLAPTSSGARETRPAALRDGTPLMTELAAAVPTLRREEKTRARALLARPSDGAANPDGLGYSAPEAVSCTTHVCLHWVTTTADAVPLADADADADAIPDWVQTTGAVVEEVWDHIVTVGGYRAPLSDATSTNPGPDGRLDVYLADIGATGLYGYCSSDDPAFEVHDNVSAYCVLDNDFAPDEFAGTPALDSLRVTAAHEFFHAVQFSYDSQEDLWMSEGTAAWMEGEVYPDLHDNLQYLGSSALTHADVPVDYDDGDFRYGAWMFWQFLTEYMGNTAANPAVIRSVWQAADASPGAPDRYSLAAVRAVAAANGISFTRLFADFSALGHMARSWYFDGNLYPQAQLDNKHAFSPRRTDTGGWWSGPLHHLTSANVGFLAKSTLTGSRRLKIDIDAPGLARGSAATVAVHRRGGAVTWYDVDLDQSGFATLAVPFTRSKVDRVVLTLTNASTRMDCWLSAQFACQGLSLDDNVKFEYKAKVIR